MVQYPKLKYMWLDSAYIKEPHNSVFDENTQSLILDPMDLLNMDQSKNRAKNHNSKDLVRLGIETHRNWLTNKQFILSTKALFFTHFSYQNLPLML